MKKENSLRLLTEKKERKINMLLPAAAAIFIMVFGFFAMFSKAFSEMNINIFYGLIPAVSAVVLLALHNKKFGKYLPSAIFTVCIAAIFIVPSLKNGLLSLYNEICEFLTALTGKIHLSAQISGESSEEITLILFVIAMTAFLSTAIYEKNMFFVVPTAVLSTLGLAVGFLSTDAFFAVFIVGFVLFLIDILKPESSGKFLLKTMFFGFGVAAVCTAFCAVLIIFVSGNSGENIASAAKKFVHRTVYDSSTNAMPEGDFDNLGAFKKNDTPALEITMENPQKLYLKGFVGEIYNGNGWENISGETLVKYADDFYILHKNGFYTQESVANSLEATNKLTNSSLSIKNISACSKRAYLPYALSNTVFDWDLIGDANTNSFGTEYTVSYVSGGLAEWYLAQVELSQNQGKNVNVDEHLKNESVYRKFVKDNYLTLSAETVATMERIFDGEKVSTATEIISTILVYLDENITYDEEFSLNGDGDFAEFFLEKSEKGYSVHYATAATLMLRYFGIPARYVEGYFLSADEAAQYKSGETIVLTEENAHAWAEYYLEGVGWIPFEVTPGYMDDELEKAAFITSGESSKRYDQTQIPETNVDRERPKSNITEAKRNGTIVIAVLTSGMLIAAIALLCYVLAMRNRLKKAISAIENADNRSAVAMRFGYASRLLENATVSEETLKKIGYDKAFTINREALFSEHEISDEKRKIVDEYSQKLLSECKDSWSGIEKLKNKWIKYLY